jgi:flagellar basal-body rod protein FlgG
LNRTMITAANTMNQLQKHLDIISNNIANAQTTGFKKRQASFSEMFVQQFQNQPNMDAEAGRLTPGGIRYGVGAKLSQVRISLAQGSIVHTGRDLDFALTVENQYFKVLARRGNQGTVSYTRDGAFYLSPVNEDQVILVNGQGDPVLDENDNPIVFDGDFRDIRLQDSGVLSVTYDDGSVREIPLGIVEVHKPQLLQQIGDNLLSLPENFAELNVPEGEILTNLQGGARIGIGLEQQALEQSNVDIGEELTKMIQVQRAYQFQARSITLADQMMGLINGLR